MKGWCVLLHLPFARRSFSASARVNKGNSIIQRKCGIRVGEYVPAPASQLAGSTESCQLTTRLGQLGQTKSLSTKCGRPPLRRGCKVSGPTMSGKNTRTSGLQRFLPIHTRSPGCSFNCSPIEDLAHLSLHGETCWTIGLSTSHEDMFSDVISMRSYSFDEQGGEYE